MKRTRFKLAKGEVTELALKVLGLASYPVEAAGTRYRLMQYIEPLAERDIDLTVRPFLDSPTFARLYDRAALSSNIASLAVASARRLLDVIDAANFDVLLVQREAMLFGPPVVEWWMTQHKARPLVLDLDDATYLPYTSPIYGKLSSRLKCFGKTDKLIRWARIVVCGNPVIAEYVNRKGVPTIIIPTVVDTNKFRPTINRKPDAAIVLGWIGTHTTFPFLEKLFPVLQRLARKFSFELKIVGAGTDEIKLPGVCVKNLRWELAREIKDFQSIDVGLYPIITEREREFAVAKSGFKAIQYMSVGVPYVVSPVGVCAEIGVAGSTHFCAATFDEWYDSLEKLLVDAALRQSMGNAGRLHALQHYTVPQQADKLANALLDAAN